MSIVCLPILLIAGCAVNREQRQRERERAVIVAVMERLSAARKVSVRRTDAGGLVPDMHRLLGEWEAIDVSRCPADFCAAWDGLLDAFTRVTATPPTVQKEIGLVDVAPAFAKGAGVAAALPLIAKLLERPASNPEAQRAIADYGRALDRLKRVLDRYGLNETPRQGRSGG